MIIGDFFPSNLHNMINYNCKPEKRKLPAVTAWFPSVLYPACAMPAAQALTVYFRECLRATAIAYAVCGRL